MRTLFFCLLVIWSFGATSNPTLAQVTDILVDTSGSTDGAEGEEIRAAVAELKTDYVEVIPWNYKAWGKLFGTGVEVASQIPESRHATRLATVLRGYEDEKVACRKIIVVVHELPDDMVEVERLIPKIIQKNFMVILVVGKQPRWLHIYKEINKSQNFVVRRLEPGVLSKFYYGETKVQGCMLELG